MRLTRREFIQASVATRGDAGRRMRDAAGDAGHQRHVAAPGEGRPAPPRATGSRAPARAARSGARSRSSSRTAARCACAAIRCRRPTTATCCPRGHLIPQQVYDPDRIKVPMKRTNPQKGRGVDPKFVPISWDEALDTVADKMIELRKNNEAHKLVYMRGRYSPTSTELLYGALPRIYGTTNYFSHSAICAEAEKMGPGLTQGFFGYRDYDLEKTQLPGDLGLRSAGVQPDGAEHDSPLPRDRGARHGRSPSTRGCPIPPPSRRSGCRSSPAPTVRWRLRSPTCC